MATITISGNTLVGCSLGYGSFTGIGQSWRNSIGAADNLAHELGDLNIRIGAACQVADVQLSKTKAVQAKTREEDKRSALTLGYQKLEELIRDVGQTDSLAAQAIKALKRDFYEKYKHLKPAYEKSWLEKLWDAAKDFASFCADHWKDILKVVAVLAMIVVSVVLIATGVGGVLGAAALGCLIGMAIKGTVTVTKNLITGKPPFAGIVDALFYGGISGAISGLITGGLGSIGLSGGLGSDLLASGISSFATNSIKYFLGDGDGRGYGAYIIDNVLMDVIGSAIGGGLGGKLFGDGDNELFKDIFENTVGEIVNTSGESLRDALMHKEDDEGMSFADEMFVHMMGLDNMENMIAITLNSLYTNNVAIYGFLGFDFLMQKFCESRGIGNDISVKPLPSIDVDIDINIDINIDTSVAIINPICFTNTFSQVFLGSGYSVLSGR